MREHEISLTVNGYAERLRVPSKAMLADVLRDQLGLTGTKKGCEEGICGSCTVELNGELVSSCLVLAVQADGGSVTTIEGIDEGGALHPVQQAFLTYGAVQCGFCTPGMIMTARAFLRENPAPSERDIRWAISGNICRCTGYVKIVEAIAAAAKEMHAAAV